MADSSFDIVSSVDLQEVKNAIAQATKELQTRFDLKNTGSSVDLAAEEIVLTSSDEFKLKAVRGDPRRDAWSSASVPLKALTFGDVDQALGGTVRQRVTLQKGIPTEKAREIVKIVKGAKLKVQTAIQGDQLRVTGKNKDDLPGASCSCCARPISGSTCSSRTTGSDAWPPSTPSAAAACSGSRRSSVWSRTTWRSSRPASRIRCAPTCGWWARSAATCRRARQARAAGAAAAGEPAVRLPRRAGDRAGFDRGVHPHGLAAPRRHHRRGHHAPGPPQRQQPLGQRHHGPGWGTSSTRSPWRWRCRRTTCTILRLLSDVTLRLIEGEILEIERNGRHRRRRPRTTST